MTKKQKDILKALAKEYRVKPDRYTDLCLIGKSTDMSDCEIDDIAEFLKSEELIEHIGYKVQASNASYYRITQRGIDAIKPKPWKTIVAVIGLIGVIIGIATDLFGLYK